MILLTSTSDVLNISLSASQTTSVHASYVDVSGSTVTPGRQNASWGAAGTGNQIVASPGASTQRNVKFISINNAGTLPNQVIVQHVDSVPTTVTLVTVILQAGYTLFYSDESGWGMMDGSGGLFSQPLVGRFLAETLLTSTSSATFTTGNYTNTIRIRGVGGGAGGGGCTSVASAAGAASGGGAGGYAEAIFTVTPNTGYTYQCGALGTGVSAANGNAGSNSTFTVGSTTVTAYGGTVGRACTSSATVPIVQTGSGPSTVSANSFVGGSGQGGDYGVVLTTSIYASGSGGSGPFGGGGLGLVAAAAGNNAVGYGAGGGGSATGASTARAGGNGTQGIWIVEEYS